MNSFKAYWKRIHWPAIVAFIPTLAGILADRDMLNLMPPKYSHMLAMAGAILQLYVKHVWKPRPEVQP